MATRGGVANQGDGVAFKGDRNFVNTGEIQGNVEMRYGDTWELPPGPQADPAALRQAYLNRVLEQTQTLQLARRGSQGRARADAQTGLALAAVYTALMTQQAEQA